MSFVNTGITAANYKKKQSLVLKMSAKWNRVAVAVNEIAAS